MTTRVPLVCTPEELGELLFWSGEVAIELYRLRIGGGNHDAANHAKDRRDAALAALFRPAEEPEVDAATRAEIEKGLAHSARGEVEPYTSAAPAAPCDHPAEDCLPEMTVGPRYGHLRCLRCGAFISPAPVAPPPAEERADFKTFKASFDREWEANVKLRQQVETLRSEVAASQREVERLRAWVANDATAISYQSMGQYRAALLRMLPPPAGGTAG